MTEEKENIWKKHCEDFPKIKTWSNEKQETAKKAYLAGYEQSREDCKSKWHDLRKDPNDLPKENGHYWCYVNYFGFQHREIFFNVDRKRFDMSEVIAWCELPEFKE